MNETTKYQLMKNRELLKGYHAGDAGAEETDQQQKLTRSFSNERKKGRGNHIPAKEFSGTFYRREFSGADHGEKKPETVWGGTADFTGAFLSSVGDPGSPAYGRDTKTR